MNSQHTSATPQHSGSTDAAPATPGRDAMVDSLDALYKGRKPLWYANPNPRSRGGQDPLDAIAVWKRVDPVPHWHYVTFGFSELYTKQQSNPLISGHGFELTMRVAIAPGANAPPVWPMRLLQNLAQYVFKTGNGFHDGHRLNAHGQLAPGHTTALRALGFAFDPELPAIDTPNGRLAFLQIVGLTADEELAAQQWETRKLLDLLLPGMPMWITDLERSSLLDDPELLARAQQGAHSNGSACVTVYADALNVVLRKRFLRKGIAEVTLGARHITQLSQLLPLRLPFGRSLELRGPQWTLRFEIARSNSWRIAGGVLTLYVKPKSVHEFATLLHPHQGVYKLPAFQHILWNVRQTTIRSPDGGVVDIIGADRRATPRS